MEPAKERDREIQQRLDELVEAAQAEVRGAVLLVHYEDGNVGVFHKIAGRLLARARMELQSFGLKAMQKILSWQQGNSRH